MISVKWSKILSTSDGRLKCIKYVCLLLVTGLILVSAPNSASAAYDIIVPSQVTINHEAGSSGSAFGYWGWVVATDNNISLSALQGASFSANSSNPNVSVIDQDFQMEDFVANDTDNPLAPGEVAGAMSAPYGPLLEADEALKYTVWSIPFWWIEFQYPVEFSGDVTLNGFVNIGGETINYSTAVSILNSGNSQIVISDAQRLSSTVIPEPISTVLFLTGGGIMVGRRYLKKKKKSLI